LKRKRVDDPHVNYVNAELFVIDHFWSCMFKDSVREGYADFATFKARMFQFFNAPFLPLLQIHEIE
jgi:hypothetical protein